MSQDFVVKLIQDIAASPHSLERKPEPAETMEEEGSVDDFNEVMKTNVTINYSAALDFIYRSRNPVTSKPSLIDLCCGPGHFTKCLNEYLGYHSITGIDLSKPMLNKAEKNIQGSEGDFRFMYADATRLSPTKFEKVDLVTCANSAHHLSTIEDVQAMIRFADQVCKPEGTVVITDLCRLPNEDVSERFISIIGDDYVKNGLLHLAQDFKASMYAAWSPDELAKAVPQESERIWFQVVAGGLPFFQGLIGLPLGRTELFVRPSKNWAVSGILRTERAKQDWAMTKDSFYAGICREIRTSHPSKKKSA